MIPAPKTIQTRFILALAAIVTVVIITFSLLLISFTSRSMELNLQQQAKRLTAFSIQTLSAALWQYNFDYVNEYIESLSMYEAVVFSTVIVSGEQISINRDARFSSFSYNDFKDSNRFLIEQEIVYYEGEKLGVFQLVLSRDKIKEQVITTAGFLLLILLLVNLAIFSTTFFLSRLYVFTPLSRLEASVKKIATGELDTVIETSGDDEISHLSQSFKQMMVNLRRITASRDELNHEISQRIETERRIDALNQLKEKLLELGSLEVKLHYITDGVVDILQADFSRIWLIRKGDRCRKCIHTFNNSESSDCAQDQCLHLLASSGRYTHRDGKHGRIPPGKYKIGAIATGEDQELLINDIYTDKRVHDHGWARRLGLKSFAGFSLRSEDDEAIGVLALFSQHTLSAQDQVLLRTIVGTTSQVIQGSETQEKLHASEKKFRNLFENAQIGMFQFRVTDGNLIESNPRMAEIHGYTSSEECITNFAAKKHYVSSQDRRRVVKLLNQRGRISNYQTQIRTVDGARKWVQFSGTVSEKEGYFEGVIADITEQKHAEKQLQESLKEKEVLLKEVHHRVKNNMQIIQSLLSLQSHESKDPDLAKALIDSNSRIRSMALIHETLYRSENIGKLDLKSYFNEIIRNLLRVYSRAECEVKVDMEIEPIDLNMDISISCGLIINELVSNALKHAFTDYPEGEITLSLQRHGNSGVKLSIGDNGRGFERTNIYEESETLGLKIVKILVTGQLGGTIQICENEGARFDIEFPIPA